MAEFSEIARQYNRMCESYKNTGCIDCPMRSLGSLGLRKLCKDAAFFTPDTFVRVVEQWAAENPETVYPSVAKYLERLGIIIRRDGTLQADFFKAHEPMSADVAKLLGVDLVEGEK